MIKESSIIKSIEIRKFRSFNAVKIEAADLNIYSGRNNSGKSNILRALNLFFNQKSDYDTPYNHQDDFNKAFGGAAGGRRAIEVTIHFWPSGRGALKDDFYIKRVFLADSSIYEQKIFSENPKTQEKIDKNDGNIIRQFTRFLNKLEYIYIPAVRDKTFIKTLLLKFETIIHNDISGEDFDNKINELSVILSEKSDGISEDFKDFIGIPARASLSSNAQDVLGAVVINVSSGIQIKNKNTKKDGGGKIVNLPVNLFSSGDGVVMSYLVFFLAFLTKKSNKKYIWGFEEPENSLEYSKVQRLAQDFYNNFSHEAQIFITTHSPAFINLKDTSRVNFYRVYIPPQREEDSRAGYPDKRSSHVQKLEKIRQLMLGSIESGDSITAALNEELHLIEQADEIQKAVESLEQERKKYEERNKDIEKLNDAVMKLCPEKIFVCEDAKAILLWEELFSKFSIDGVKVMTSGGVYSDTVEKWIEGQMRIKNDFSPAVWREVDRDGFTDAQKNAIEAKYKNRCHGASKYKYSMLPVNELENFILLDGATVSDEEFQSMRDAIIEKFERTVSSNLNMCNKYVSDDKTIFPAGNTEERIDVLQVMRRDALRDWRRYMPGKDIVKQKDNINVLEWLKEMEVGQLPEELISYIKDIKEFFHG